MKDKIIEWIKKTEFGQKQVVMADLRNNAFRKKLKIWKDGPICHIGNGIYDLNVFILLYSGDLLSLAYNCRITGTGQELDNRQIDISVDYLCDDRINEHWNLIDLGNALAMEVDTGLVANALAV